MDRRADRTVVVVHAFERRGIDLLAGRMRDRNGETSDDSGRQGASEEGELRTDTCLADAEFWP
jgi:hypothetical protein